MKSRGIGICHAAAQRVVNARMNSCTFVPIMVRHDRPMQPQDSASEARPYRSSFSLVASAIEKEAELCYNGLDSVCKDHDAMRSRIQSARYGRTGG